MATAQSLLTLVETAIEDLLSGRGHIAKQNLAGMGIEYRSVSELQSLRKDLMAEVEADSGSSSTTTYGIPGRLQ